MAEKERAMEEWRKERDTLVAALEIQLQKLLTSQAEKDKLIKELSCKNTDVPQEVSVTQSLHHDVWSLYMSRLTVDIIETEQRKMKTSL